MIVIITGTSGAGKTTLKKYFQQRFSDVYTIYDFDDVGVPNDADEYRRKKTTEFRISKIRSESGDILLFGQIVPDEILSDKDDILFIFLEIDRKTTQMRLVDRGWSKDHIEPYQNWTNYIKKSVLRQKIHTIISTQQTVEQSAKDIITYIQTYHATKK